MFLQQLKDKYLAASIRLYFSPVLLPCLALLVAMVGFSAVVEAQQTEYEPVPDYWFAYGYCRIISLAVGSFGALVMVVAGIVAIVSAAGGNYRTAVSVIMVACGAFILENIIDLFFDLHFECEIGSPGGGSGDDFFYIDLGFD